MVEAVLDLLYALFPCYWINIINTNNTNIYCVDYLLLVQAIYMFTSLVLTKTLYEIGTIIQINLLVRKIRKRKVKCAIYGKIENKIKTRDIIFY